MGKTGVTTLAVVAALLLGTTVVMFAKYRATSTEYASVKQAEEGLRARYGEAINSIAAIQDSLNAIIVGDSEVPLASNGLAAERRLTGSQADEAMERIAVLKLGIERAKDKIRTLDEKLRHSGIRVAGLQRMLVNLQRDASAKEQEVTLLTARVDSLQNTVVTLASEVEESHAEIEHQVASNEEKRKELGTVYYVIGPTRMLKESGVVAAEGGVFGMGKGLKPTGNTVAPVYTAIDTDLETTIRIPGARARVLSAQPLSSYTLVPAGTDAMELRITDPREFRKVRHLVILTG